MPRRFHVGDWEIEPQLNRIRKDQETIQLEPKLMGVLMALVERAGEVVSREYLIAKVWPDTHVSESILRRAISELRRILGDDARNPSYLATVPKAGYRLIAVVVERKLEKEEGPIFETVVPAAARSHRFGRGMLLTLISLVIVMLITWQLVKDEEVQETHHAITELTGRESEPELSPSGNKIVFTWSYHGDYEICVKDRDGSNIYQVSEGKGKKLSPCWSPDGNKIAYVLQHKDSAEIFSVVPRKANQQQLWYYQPGFIDGITFQDDFNLIISARAEKGKPLQLYRLNLLSKQTEPLTKPPSRFLGDSHPRLSPDGDQLAFIRRVSDDVQDIFVMPASGGDPVRLTFMNRLLGGVDWYKDNQTLIFSAYRSGAYNLWLVSRRLTQPVPLSTFSDNIRNPDVSDNVLSYERLQFTTEIMRMKLKAGIATKPSVFVSSKRWDSVPRFSPDGKKIAFVSNRAGSREIWLVGHHAGDLEQLTSFGGPYTSNPSWSPEGRRIAFESHVDGHGDIHFLDLHGGLTRRLTFEESDEVLPTWSTDGATLYFASNRGGSWQIWNIAAEGGVPQRITRGGGYRATPSADGKQLYFSHFQRPGIWSVPLMGGPEKEIAPLPNMQWSNWLVTPKGIYHVDDPADKKPALALYDLKSKRVNRLFELNQLPEPGSLNISPDGTWVLFARVENYESEIVLLPDFLKDKTELLD